MSKLLEDILVLDFSQFLSGPSAGLRLADMGARVIKIEKEGTGDICRTLYVSDVKIEGGESTIFHAINRNKESYSINVKNAASLAKIKKLIAKADVLIHNFRPGVMARLGLNYEIVKTIHPAIIYGEITGYGEESEWKDLPGQDLLLQAVSGITYLSGKLHDPPVPMGVAVADIIAGTHLVQGILAAMLQRIRTNEGSFVQVSMLESLLDFQFEVLSCFFNDGGNMPVRSAISGAHAYMDAPYGIYKTLDGFVAIALTPLPVLATLLNEPALDAYSRPQDGFVKRDEIKKLLAELFKRKPTAEWLEILEPAGMWCADVYDYNALLASEAYKILELEQWVVSGGKKIKTTRCPARVDGDLLTSPIGAPQLGEHNEKIDREFGLQENINEEHEQKIFSRLK